MAEPSFNPYSSLYSFNNMSTSRGGTAGNVAMTAGTALQYAGSQFGEGDTFRAFGKDIGGKGVGQAGALLQGAGSLYNMLTEGSGIIENQEQQFDDEQLPLMTDVASQERELRSIKPGGHIGSMAGKGALAGASVGAAFGGFGAAIGAGVGALAGTVGGFLKKKRIKNDIARNMEKLEASRNNFNASTSNYYDSLDRDKVMRDIVTRREFDRRFVF